MEVSLDALAERAALLPRVISRPPRSILGKNTVEQLQSGVFYGFAAVVEGVCAKIKDEIGPVHRGGHRGAWRPWSCRPPR